MKLFLTGGCGFIGSNFIINQLLHSTNKILNLDKLTYAGNLSNLKSFRSHPNYTFINGDICDTPNVKRLIFDFKPDRIINFAAETHVDRSIVRPVNFINTNIVGTSSLLHGAIDYYNQTKNTDFNFIQISTDEVFGSLDSNDPPFIENSHYLPNSPYSASKASSDLLVRSWHKTYKLPVTITNCSNNYGPFQFPEKLIPLIITNAVDLKPLPIYGDGSNIRDWLFVEDHCKAINSIINSQNPSFRYNIGGNNEFSNLNIVKYICDALDTIQPLKDNSSYKKLITFVEDRPGHDFRYAIDSTKIFNDLSWKPSESFESGILKTIHWYLENETWWRDIQSEKIT